MIGLIIAVLTLIILIVGGIWSFYVILEAFKLPIVIIASIFLFFGLAKWLQSFEIEKKFSYLISAILTFTLAIALYQSLMAIVVLGIIATIVWFAYYLLVPKSIREKIGV